MRMLFVNQFFWPDSSATSQQLTDLVKALAARGEQIEVVCGHSGGYAAAAGTEAPSATVHRVKTLPFTRGKLGRVFSYLSFYVSAFARGLTLRRPDVVVSMTTPPLISLLGTCIQLLRGSRHFIWEQDVYPDIAVDLRHIRHGSPLHRVTGALADWSRRRADGIVVLGECMRDRLVSRGVAPEKIYIAEHWADSTSITPMARPGNPEELVLLYSGNLGLAHDLDTLLGTMRALRDDARFRFLFVGTGGRRKALTDFLEANGIGSAELRPFVDRDKLSEGLAAGDIGLVTQQESACGSVVPSKVYGILAAGRPLLFIGPSSATPARIIRRHGCGWHFACGDVTGVTAMLQHLAGNRHLVLEAGARARQALLSFYDLPQSVDRIADILGAAPRTGHKTRAGAELPRLERVCPLPN